MSQEHGNFGGCNGDSHVDDHGYRRQSCKQSKDNEAPASDLKHADEWGHDLGIRDADFNETTDSKGIGKEKFLDAFG